MNYDLKCKVCKEPLGFVRENLINTFFGCNHFNLFEIVTWYDKVEREVDSRTGRIKYAICPKCNTVHEVYSIYGGKQYVLRRKNNKK